MKSRLQTGQGLIAGQIGATLSRWRSYCLIICFPSVALGILFPIFCATGDQKSVWFTTQLARLENSIFTGTPIKPTLQVSLANVLYTIQSQNIPNVPMLKEFADGVNRLVIGGASAGAMLGAAACLIYARWIEASGVSARADNQLRGSRVIGAAELAKMTSQMANPSSISIANVPIPNQLETRHFAISGSTGSGKTTALMEILDKIEKRQNHALVYDTSGEFISNYYNPHRGDIILNPLDRRGAFWSLFQEIQHPADADNIAARLVPITSGQDDSIWSKSATVLVANIIRSMWAEGRTELPQLLNAIQKLPREDLKSWLSDTSSARSFETDAEKATASILFNLTMTATVLQYLKSDPGEGSEFSFRKFYKELDQFKGSKPWIFIPRREDHAQAMAPLLSCWLDCAANAILGLDPHPSRRIWMILDELPDIPKVQNLQRLLPLGRKFGASVVITFQAVGQMRHVYGNDIAEAMLGCCNTKIFLQLIDAESRRWASDTVGQLEAEVRGATESLALQIGQGRTSLGSQRLIRPAVLESEFRLPKFHGFLQLPDGLPTAKIILTNDHIVARGPATHPAFVPGDVADTLWSNMTNNPPSGPILPEGGPI